MQKTFRGFISHRALIEIDHQLVEPTFDSLSVILERIQQRSIPEHFRERLSKRLSRSEVLAESQVAANDVLQQTRRWLLNQRVHHVAQHSCNSNESLKR